MDNSKYTDRIKYYQTLEQKLLPTDEERVYIKEASITLQGLDGIRLVKKSGGIFDRDTCNNFLKMSDLLSDEQLLHSIETIRDYTKEYTDSEVESDERIRQVKADSLEEIEYQIHLAKTILVLFGDFFPIGRAISWISEFRADRNLMSSILFATMPPTDDNGDLNKDIYLEICNEELDELLKKAEYNSPEIEDCKEVLRNIVSYSSTQSNGEFIDEMSGLFLYFTLCFYEPKILGAYFTTKEYNVLKERMDNVLTYLKEYYSGTQCTKLIHHFRNYVSASKSMGTFFYSTINEQPEFKWLKNSNNVANVLPPLEKWNVTALKKLFRSLKKTYEQDGQSGFIDCNTIEEDFIYAFGYGCGHGFTPIKWIGKYKNKPGKSQILDLLCIMGYDINQLRCKRGGLLDNLNFCFDKEFASNDFPKKGNGTPNSQVHDTLQKMVENALK